MNYYRRKYRRAPYGYLWLLILGMLICVVYSVVARAETLQERVTTNSARYLNVREATNKNDGPDVERFLAYIGLPKGQSWCMAFVCYNYRHDAGFTPWPRNGRCAAVWKQAQARELTYRTFSAEDVQVGAEKLQPGDVAIWAHGGINAARDFNGHTGIVLGQRNRNSFVSREGNTMPSNVGNQREGGGVYDRTRGLGIGSSFRIVGFVRVR